MSGPVHKAAVSFQTKVLAPVLTMLVLVPAATVFIVDRHFKQEVQAEAQQTLATAKAVFRRSLENQAGELLARFRNVAGEASYRAIVLPLADQVASSDAPAARQTIEMFLRGRLAEYGPETEVLMLVSARDGRMVGAVQGGALTLEAFASAAENVTARALRGDGAGEAMSLGGRNYHVVAVPVRLPARNDELVAALAVGVRITETALRDLKTLQHTEAVLVADRAVAVTTLRNPEAIEGLLPAHWPVRDTDVPRQVEIDDEHFLALAATYGGAAHGVRYLLLSSFEPQLRALAATRQTLIGVSIAGVVLGGLVVGFLVRRVTQPLRELRDLAEAVGRGDFSRKIERFSNDECGELAEEFNRMTTNLRSSRAELEKTVETLKNTQAQLIQSEKLSAVGQFVAGVAHELNNPLTTVIGFADLLSGVEQDDKSRRYHELIAKSAHRCHKIVQSLLSFARQHAPERKLAGVNALIEDVLEIMAYDLRTSNVAVKRELADGLPSLMVDPHQLQQVFINILGNARQAIEPFRRDGEIVVRTRATDGFVRIEFRDNGPGIRPENLSRIFDPFFTTKPVGKGTGLGLSLSYGIIQEHGGRIGVESEPGHGARFTIELPVASRAKAVAAPGDSASPFARPAVAAGTSVLVVDDEEWILELTRELLQREGYEVETVAGGSAALERLEAREFDVIVCDWKMPGLNGIHLYEQLLATKAALAERMLFMTGDVINETFQEFLRRNARRCLSKPFAIEDFRAAVAGVLAGKPA